MGASGDVSELSVQTVSGKLKCVARIFFNKTVINSFPEWFTGLFWK